MNLRKSTLLRVLTQLLALFGVLLGSALPALAVGEKPPQNVFIGAYINQIPELDVKTNTFQADFYLWFRWKGALDPTHTWEIMNAMERNNLWKEASYKDAAGADKPEVLPHGEKYQEYHVQGRFAQPYLLADYPLDKQQMSLHVEDKLYDTTQLQYLPDQTQSKVRPTVSVPGWIIEGFLAETNSSHYDTNFGDPSASASSTQSYSRASFTLHVVRPISSVVAKTVLPLTIVLLITFSAMLLKSTNIEARTTLTITALMSAVALHYTDMTELPPTGYLTLLDKIYILSYLLIFAAIVLCIGSYRLADAGREETALKLDRASLAGLLVVAALGFAVLTSGH